MVLEACECQRIHQIERANTADEHRWLRSLECLACVSVRKVMSARFAREFSKVCRVSRCSSGLYPDVMHILHLAVIPDAVVSVFLEYTDDESIFSEANVMTGWKSFGSSTGLGAKMAKSRSVHRGNFSVQLSSRTISMSR